MFLLHFVLLHFVWHTTNFANKMHVCFMVIIAFNSNFEMVVNKTYGLMFVNTLEYISVDLRHTDIPFMHPFLVPLSS